MAKIIPNPKATPADDTKQCPRCLKENLLMVSECKWCGYRFYWVCTECGKTNPDVVDLCQRCKNRHKKFCPFCGVQLPMHTQRCGVCHFWIWPDVHCPVCDHLIDEHPLDPSVCGFVIADKTAVGIPPPDSSV